MRILEETKDYAINYFPYLIGNNIPSFFMIPFKQPKDKLFYFGFIKDKKTNVEQYACQIQTGDYNKDIYKLGKKLLKIWRLK